jgi:hypothetical protein
MSDQPPRGNAPLPCSRCHAPVHFMMTIPLVDEPGRTQIFECDRCDNLEFRTET